VRLWGLSSRVALAGTAPDLDHGVMMHVTRPHRFETVGVTRERVGVGSL